jgi:hypothetical protein
MLPWSDPQHLDGLEHPCSQLRVDGLPALGLARFFRIFSRDLPLRA